MGVPTHGEEFAKLLEHLRLAQEDCAMLSHLVRAEGGKKDNILAQGWLTVSEGLRRMQFQVTKLAQGRLQ